jgi:hypothetical protein
MKVLSEERLQCDDRRLDPGRTVTTVNRTKAMMKTLSGERLWQLREQMQWS